MAMTSLSPGVLFKSHGINQRFTNSPTGNGSADAQDSQSINNRSPSPCQRGSPVAEVYDVNNSSAKMVLLNNRMSKNGTRLRGVAEPRRVQRYPNPDRHLPELTPRKKPGRHGGCLDSSTPRFEPSPRVPEMWRNQTQRPPWKPESSRHVPCQVTQSLRPQPPKRKLNRTRSPPPTLSRSQGRTSSQTSGSNRKMEVEYFWSVAKIYSSANMKILKQLQYQQLLLKQMTLGAHNRNEYEKYVRYICGPRKRQFGTDAPVVIRVTTKTGNKKKKKPAKQSSQKTKTTKGETEHKNKEEEITTMVSYAKESEDDDKINYSSDSEFSDTEISSRASSRPKSRRDDDYSPVRSASSAGTRDSQYEDEKPVEDDVTSPRQPIIVPAPPPGTKPKSSGSSRESRYRAKLSPMSRTESPYKQDQSEPVQQTEAERKDKHKNKKEKKRKERSAEGTTRPKSRLGNREASPVHEKEMVKDEPPRVTSPKTGESEPSSQEKAPKERYEHEDKADVSKDDKTNSISSNKIVEVDNPPSEVAPTEILEAVVSEPKATPDSKPDSNIGDEKVQQTEKEPGPKETTQVPDVNGNDTCMEMSESESDMEQPTRVKNVEQMPILEEKEINTVPAQAPDEEGTEKEIVNVNDTKTPEVTGDSSPVKRSSVHNEPKDAELVGQPDNSPEEPTVESPSEILGVEKVEKEEEKPAEGDKGGEEKDIPNDSAPTVPEQSTVDEAVIEADSVTNKDTLPDSKKTTSDNDADIQKELAVDKEEIESNSADVSSDKDAVAEIEKDKVSSEPVLKTDETPTEPEQDKDSKEESPAAEEQDTAGQAEEDSPAEDKSGDNESVPAVQDQEEVKNDKDTEDSKALIADDQGDLNGNAASEQREEDTKETKVTNETDQTTEDTDKVAPVTIVVTEDKEPELTPDTITAETVNVNDDVAGEDKSESKQEDGPSTEASVAVPADTEQTGDKRVVDEEKVTDASEEGPVKASDEAKATTGSELKASPDVDAPAEEVAGDEAKTTADDSKIEKVTLESDASDYKTNEGEPLEAQDKASESIPAGVVSNEDAESASKSNQPSVEESPAAENKVTEISDDDATTATIEENAANNPGKDAIEEFAVVDNKDAADASEGDAICDAKQDNGADKPGEDAKEESPDVVNKDIAVEASSDPTSVSEEDKEADKPSEIATEESQVVENKDTEVHTSGGDPSPVAKEDNEADAAGEDSENAEPETSMGDSSSVEAPQASDKEAPGGDMSTADSSAQNNDPATESSKEDSSVENKGSVPDESPSDENKDTETEMKEGSSPVEKEQSEVEKSEKPAELADSSEPSKEESTEEKTTVSSIPENAENSDQIKDSQAQSVDPALASSDKVDSVEKENQETSEQAVEASAEDMADKTVSNSQVDTQEESETKTDSTKGDNSTESSTEDREQNSEVAKETTDTESSTGEASQQKEEPEKVTTEEQEKPSGETKPEEEKQSEETQPSEETKVESKDESQEKDSSS